jgi:hypothetical protein
VRKLSLVHGYISVVFCAFLWIRLNSLAQFQCPKVPPKTPHKVTERTILRVRSLTLSLALDIALREIHISRARISGIMHTSILSVLVFFLLSILVRHQIEAQSQGNVNATLTFTSSTSFFYYIFPTIVTVTLPECAVCLCNSGILALLINFLLD